MITTTLPDYDYYYRCMVLVRLLYTTASCGNLDAPPRWSLRGAARCKLVLLIK